MTGQAAGVAAALAASAKQQPRAVPIGRLQEELARLTAPDPFAGLPDPGLHPQTLPDLDLADPDRNRLPQSGFDHHFVKPVATDTLLALFKTVGE